jgi:hypothetical protein
MHWSRKKFTLLLIFVVITLVAGMYLPVQLPYSIETQALIKPYREWDISRNTNGNLLSTLRNHEKGTIETYAFNEFDRGDAVKFELHPELSTRTVVQKGDTIGYFYSNEVELQLLQLEGELRVLQAEKTFYTAGQKPEDIAAAEREIGVRKQELDVLQLMRQRSAALLKDSAISQQQYDLEYNAAKVKETEIALAEARLASLKAGDKPEQIAWVAKKMDVITDQIRQLKQRLNYLVITSPIEGVLVLQRNLEPQEIVIKVMDQSKWVAVAPVLQEDIPYIGQTSEASLRSPKQSDRIAARILGTNNVHEHLNGHEVTYLLMELAGLPEDIKPGSLEKVWIAGKRLNPREYLLKLLNTPV